MKHRESIWDDCTLGIYKKFTCEAPLSCRGRIWLTRAAEIETQLSTLFLGMTCLVYCASKCGTTLTGTQVEPSSCNIALRPRAWALWLSQLALHLGWAANPVSAALDERAARIHTWSLGPWALEFKQIENPAPPFLSSITLSKWLYLPES